MKIVMVSNNFPPEIIGGAEIYAKQLSDEVSKYEELFVFAARYDFKKIYSTYDISKYWHDYPVYRIELGTGALNNKNPFNFYNPFIGRKFKKIIGIEKPELLHAHNLAGLSLSPIACSKKNLKIPVIMTLHDFWLICPKNTLLTADGRLCEYGGTLGCDGCSSFFMSPVSNISIKIRNKIVNKLSKNIDVFISPSKNLMEIMLDRGYDFDILHVDNGLDLEKFRNIERSDKTGDVVNVLMLSSISHHKGVHILIDAVKNLVEKGHNNIRVILAGSIENENKLREYIKIKKLKNIVILGKVSGNRKLELLKEADILILPSICCENQPLTIIEAMASGLPVIGSNVGGIPEMIIDKQNGYLFERGDSEDLSKKIEELLLDRKKRRIFGNNGRKRAIKRYSIHKNANTIMKIYQNLL